MDQTSKSSSASDQKQQKKKKSTDQNNNNNSKCACTNISIMQLFHEMKQEFPKVPDPIVQQLATDHCHDRRACIDQLRQATIAATPTNTTYPSKSIHQNNQTPRSPLPAAKFQNNHKMREISEKFENTTAATSPTASTSSQSDSAATSSSLSCGSAARPTTLRLRRAPDPPSMISKTKPQTNAISSNSSTPTSSITSLSKVNSVSSSASSLVSSGISSCHPSTRMLEQPNTKTSSQFHHSVTLDSSATKYSDSLKVQLDVTVSPFSHPPPLPPRHVSQLSMQPKPAFTKLLEDSKTSPGDGGASVSTGSMGQRSYTSVNFTLRQPTSILPSPVTPIDIQAGPSSLTYSSSSFDAKQGYQSHLKITVAGNGESCIQAVRTKPTAGSLPELSQIDTTISVGSDATSNDCEPISIVTNNQKKLPSTLISDRLMTDEELRRLIQKQLKQKELLDNELSREQEKLELIRFDIITLSTPMISDFDLRQLCDEIFRLRDVCNRLADDLDIATEPPRSPRSPASMTHSPQPRRPPPPIPAALQCLSRQHSPYHSSSPLTLSPFDHLNVPSSRLGAHQPPSYSDVMRQNSRSEVVQSANSLPNLNNTDESNDECWPCSICTFLNYPLLNQCEQCEMPRIQGIKITHSSFRPLRENNQYQGNAAAAASHSPNRTNNASASDQNNESSSSMTQPATAL